MICTLRRMARMTNMKREDLHSWVLRGIVPAKEFLIADTAPRGADPGRLMDWSSVAVTQLRVIKVLRGLGVFVPEHLAARAESVGRLIRAHGAKAGSVVSVVRSMSMSNRRVANLRIGVKALNAMPEEHHQYVHALMDCEAVRINSGAHGTRVDAVAYDLTAIHRDTIDLDDMPVRLAQQQRFQSMEKFELRKVVIQEAVTV